MAIEGKTAQVNFPGSPPFTTTIADLVFVERPAPPASDNVPSAGSELPIVDRAKPIFTLLTGIRTLAQATDNPDAVDTCDLLLGMRWDTARQLAENGQMGDILQLHYDNVISALSAWSTTFSEFLNDLHEQLNNQ